MVAALDHEAAGYFSQDRKGMPFSEKIIS
jgi:hypothetical protein